MGSQTSKEGYCIIKITNENIEFKINESIYIFCDNEFIIKSNRYNSFMKKNDYVCLFSSNIFNANTEYEILVNPKSKICLYSVSRHGIIKIFQKQVMDDCNLKIQYNYKKNGT